MVESFGLLNDLFPFPSILDAGYPVLIFIWQISCLMLYSHLYLGFLCDLFVRGFHLNIFLTVLVSGILCTWPNQLSLWALIQLTIFVYLINLSSSSLILILHIWFSLVGPNILLKIFLSNVLLSSEFKLNKIKSCIWGKSGHRWRKPLALHTLLSIANVARKI